MSAVSFDTCLCPRPHGSHHTADRSSFLLQRFHRVNDSRSEIPKITRRSDEDFSLEVTPEVEVARGKVGTPRRPFDGMIQGNDPVLEELSQSLPHDQSAVGGGPILNPPYARKGSVCISVKFPLKFRYYLFVDQSKLGLSI